MWDLRDGGVLARYTTENDSYYGTLLHLQRGTGESRFPMYDSIGSARGLLDAGGSVTDTYDMDTFGKQLASTGSTPNPYQYGAAWGYITDASGFLQLGARYYWPEVGRFVQQDALGEGTNWYLYVRGQPTTRKDPRGEKCQPLTWSFSWPAKGGPIQNFWFRYAAKHDCMEWCSNNYPESSDAYWDCTGACNTVGGGGGSTPSKETCDRKPIKCSCGKKKVGKVKMLQCKCTNMPPAPCAP